MYDFKSTLVIDYHGCEAAVRDELLMRPERIKISKKPFDWLGHGFYFWENNVERAWQWSLEKKSRGVIEQPAVIGAVLQLGYCCDFLESQYLHLLSRYYQLMVEDYHSGGIPLPVNKDVNTDPHKDKLLRYLDCAVIEYMNAEIEEMVKTEKMSTNHSHFKIFDSIRGAFFEGGPAFDGSGIYAKTHIQICIRNPNCIKGFFMPRNATNHGDWLQSNRA
jgi:hypothetical protein